MGRAREEVWGVVDFALSDMGCLARDCARDEVARKFVEPALELMMLDKALEGKLDRREALLRFGEMYATAIAGDGTVESREVEPAFGGGLGGGATKVVLVVGGELGGGATLLRLATLRSLNELLPDGLRFGVHTYVGEGIYRITAYGGDAARLMRLLAAAAPSAGGEYLSPKFEEFVGEARAEVRFGGMRLTQSGRVAADLTISEGNIDVKYNVYLREHDILLQFASTDRGRAELAARLLKLAGVDAEVKKEGERGVWYVKATTDKLAAGRKELRDAIAEVVRRAAENGWVNRETADRWLDKLERGRALREGWPKYNVQLTEGALVVRYMSTNPESIERIAEELRKMGLEEGRHFAVKKPEGGRKGYVLILKEGLAYAAWLSVHGEGERQRLAAEFVEHILERAKEEGDDVYRKALEVVEEGKARGSLKLEGFEREVGGRLVKVIGGGAEFGKGRSGRTLLRIKITAEVDGVRNDYEIAFGRYKRSNKALGFAYARAGAPGGREADAERLSALVEALTGKRPKVRRMRDGTIIIECGREHLDRLMRFAELYAAIMRWLEETGR
ncbi:MAG: PaRep2b protein [Thermoproteus sp.]